MKIHLFVIGLFLLVVLALTACGGSANSASKTLDVTLTDFAFTPNSFSVPAGATITLSALNNGASLHSLLILKKGVRIQSHFLDTDRVNVFWGTDQILPGLSINATFVAPADPGEYQIVCGVSGHFEAGMIAKLIVLKP